MRCPKCRHDNPDGAKHCAECGASLTASDSPWGETEIRPEQGQPRDDSDLWGETEIAPDRSQASFEAGRRIAGRYEVVRELGRGGMGVVYLVRDTHLRDREIALKVIHPALIRHPEAERRFEDEVIISQDLAHDHIIRVYSLERDGDGRFFTMEYLPGRSLREEIEKRQARGETFSLSEAATVIDQVLDALAYAHQRTIHRDIKPDNIMLMGDWPEVKVKVMDFGIAKTLSPSRLTTTAQSMGTAYYMAPEQLAGAKNVTPAADLFSVGVMFYEMLTGEVPAGMPLPPSELVEGLTKSVDDVARRALTPRPENRFSTAAEFRAALAEVTAAAERLRQEQDKRRAEGEKRQAEEERRRKEAEEKRRQEEKRRAEEERLRQEAERRRAAEAEPVRAQEPGKPRRKIGWLIAAALAVVVAVGGYLGVTWYQNKVAEEKRIEAKRRAEEARRRAAARKPVAPAPKPAKHKPAAKPAPKPARPKPVAKPAAKPAPKPVKAKKYFTNSIGMKFVLIPAGSFMMGSPQGELHRDNYERQHRVLISRPFYMQTTEVTQAQYRAIMGKNPSHLKGCDRCPVEKVSWDDAQEFILKLNARERTNSYRLPTEAEWEYACRAGTTTPFSFGQTISTDQANYDGGFVYGSGQKGVYRRKTTRVGSFPPNRWGLYDMHGNVWEWCRDWSGMDYYSTSLTQDPQGPPSGAYRVVRGGSWNNHPYALRSARRGGRDPWYRYINVGFRVVMDYSRKTPALKKSAKPKPTEKPAAIPAPEPVKAKKPIKLAVFEPLSGTFRYIGVSYLEGVKYAAKVINARGGINGRKVEVIAVDSQLKPAVATRKAIKLILTQGVKFFCGGTGSAIAHVLVELAKKHNFLFFTYGMAKAGLTGSRCDRHFFRACANTDTQSFALANWVAQQGFTRVFCIAQDYSFGREAIAGFIKKLKQLNPQAKIVGKILHPIFSNDFAPYVSRIIASGAEVVFTPNWGRDLALLLKQAKPLGLKAKFACYYLNDETAITAIANDPAVIGSVAAEVYMLSIPGKKNRAFIKGFKKATGHYPTWMRGKAYTATMFWAAAVKKAGTDDVNKVIKAWEGLKFNGPAGTWVMRACDHQVQQPIWIAPIVAKNPFFKHAYVGPAKMVAPNKIAVPCAQTGCQMGR